MNQLEKKMVELLVELKARDNCVAVKMEFEAEGTRIEEAMRLKEIASRAGLDLAVKIGGCEAIRDMFEAASIGTKILVAPMVETPYALRKFLQATSTAFTEEQRDDMELFVNVETISSCKNFREMLEIPEIEQLDGIVIGRVDLTGSLGLDRNSVNGEQIRSLSWEIAAQAKTRDLKVVVGGAVSAQAMDFLRSFPKGHLDRFETRKIIFGCPGALENREDAFLLAVDFELAWLRNKKAHYQRIFGEDDARLAMMEERYRKSIETARLSRPPRA